MKGKLLLLFGALVLSVYAAELALYVRDRLFAEGVPAALVAERCPGPARVDHRCIEAIREDAPFDPRSAFQIFNESAEQGDTIWPAVPATLFKRNEGLEVAMAGDDSRMVRPLSGISGVPTLLCNESGTWVSYVSDEHGFNNPPGIHESEAIPFAVVGDSFVHGWCVPPDQTVAGRLTSRIGLAVNLGIEAGGPLAQLGLLREFGRPLRPEVVLWLFFGENDPGDLELEMRTPILARYLDASFSQELASLQTELDHGLRSVIQDHREEQEAALNRRGRRARTERLGRGSQVGAFAKLQRLRGLVGQVSTPRWEREYPWDPNAFGQVLGQARDEVESWGGELVFVYLPSWRRFAHPEHASPHKASILAAAQSLGLTVIDPTPAFEAHDDATRLFPFGVDGHYTAEGFGLLVDEIVRGLPRP